MARPKTTPFNVHILLEQTQTGRTTASILELNDCQVEANTRQEALEAIQALIRDRLTNVEVIPLAILPNQSKETLSNPWIEFIGLFENDADFADMAKDWQPTIEES